MARPKKAPPEGKPAGQQGAQGGTGATTNVVDDGAEGKTEPPETDLDDLVLCRPRAVRGADDAIPDDADVPPPSMEDEPGEQAERKSQATVMVDLVRGCAELWMGDDEHGYASYKVDGHQEHHRIRSRAVREWMADLYYEINGRAAGGQARTDAIETLCGAARRGDRHPVHLRVGADGDRVVVDLCDRSWRAVVVDRDGWQVVNESPIRFIRRGAMQALAEPVRGGRLDELREHVRCTDETWPLIAGYLVGALAPSGPYPVLLLRGRHGSGKSQTARRLRDLVDASGSELRSEPREPRDLIVAARGSWVIALDNVSSLPAWLSDGLCRMATGGGYSARALYTDEDEIVIDVQRPVLLTGITDVVTAPDLLDRALLVELEPIATGEERTERELVAAWREARPRILGALFDAVACAVRRRDQVRLHSRVRMADWAVWATAAEPAMGLADGAVVEAHVAMRDDATEVALEASPIAAPLRELGVRATKSPSGEWIGTTAELLATLGGLVDDSVRRRRTWPQTPRNLAGALIRIAPSLTEVGLNLSRLPRRHGGRRPWRLAEVGFRPSPPSPNDKQAESQGKPGDGRGDGRTAYRHHRHHDRHHSSACNHSDGDGGDGGDGRNRTSTNGSAPPGDVGVGASGTHPDGSGAGPPIRADVPTVADDGNDSDSDDGNEDYGEEYF